MIERYKSRKVFLEEVMDVKLTPLDKKLLELADKGELKIVCKPQHSGKHLYLSGKN